MKGTHGTDCQCSECLAMDKIDRSKYQQPGVNQFYELSFAYFNKVDELIGEYNRLNSRVKELIYTVIKLENKLK